MKILLTGARGFIGRNLKEQLGKKFNLYTPSKKILDLTDQEAVRKYLGKYSFDTVIHCANANDFIYNISDFDLLSQNLQMFYNLETCQNLYGKMYYFGSGAEYDMEHYVPLMKETYFGTYIPMDFRNTLCLELQSIAPISMTCGCLVYMGNMRNGNDASFLIICVKVLKIWI